MSNFEANFRKAVQVIKETDLRPIAVRDPQGRLLWFCLSDTQRWTSTTAIGGQLFQVGDNWAVMEDMSAIRGEPARLVDDETALEWLRADA